MSNPRRRGAGAGPSNPQASLPSADGEGPVADAADTIPAALQGAGTDTTPLGGDEGDDPTAVKESPVDPDTASQWGNDTPAALEESPADSAEAAAEISAVRPPMNEQAQTLFHEGIKLYEEGLVGQAADKISAALKLEPEDPELLCGLGRVQEESGDFQGAIATYERYVLVETNPGPKSGVERLLTRLRNVAGDLAKRAAAVTAPAPAPAAAPKAAASPAPSPVVTQQVDVPMGHAKARIKAHGFTRISGLTLEGVVTNEWKHGAIGIFDEKLIKANAALFDLMRSSDPVTRAARAAAHADGPSGHVFATIKKGVGHVRVHGHEEHGHAKKDHWSPGDSGFFPMAAVRAHAHLFEVEGDEET